MPDVPIDNARWSRLPHAFGSLAVAERPCLSWLTARRRCVFTRSQSHIAMHPGQRNRPHCEIRRRLARRPTAIASPPGRGTAGRLHRAGRQCELCGLATRIAAETAQQCVQNPFRWLQRRSDHQSEGADSD
jgi:hypothetical protein